MRRKLFLTTLAIVLLTLTLSMLAVNLVFNQQFDDYLTQTTEAKLLELPAQLSTAYETYGSWDQRTLERVARSLPMGTQVTLLDPNGQQIAEFGNSMQGMMRGMRGMLGSNIRPVFKTKNLPVLGTQGELATAVVSYPSRGHALNAQESVFTAAIFRSLLMAGGLALLLGILLSYWTSRRLAAPLQHLTEAAERIGQGQFDQCVSVNTKDEVGKLALAFNTMADNLQKQERLRKQFTADIAHELRTPLTSIRSYIEAFQDGVLPPDAENLASLQKEIDRLVDLSSSLRDLNLAEIGELKLNVQPVDLGNLLNNVLHNLQPLLHEKNLALSWHPPSVPLVFNGDEQLLTQLFFNLLYNAYRYSEANDKITVELAYDSRFVTVYMTDTGIGIAEHDLPNIFERFYRADKSRARKTGGAGIGLALVRQITELHRGDVSVRSKLGEGSTFTVKLPRN